MQKKMVFHKEHNSLSTVPFKSPCKFCNLQCVDLIDNLCFFCNKVLNYTKENDIIIYDLSNFFWFLAKEKDNLLISWHDLQEYEQKLNQKIDLLPCMFYHRQRFALFIDLGALDFIKGCTKENILSVIKDIFDFSCKFFVLSKDKFNIGFFAKDIDDFLLGADKKRVKGINLSLKKLSPNLICRSKLKTLFFENLDFIK